LVLRAGRPLRSPSAVSCSSAPVGGLCTATVAALRSGSGRCVGASASPYGRLLDVGVSRARGRRQRRPRVRGPLDLWRPACHAGKPVWVNGLGVDGTVRKSQCSKQTFSLVSVLAWYASVSFPEACVRRATVVRASPGNVVNGGLVGGVRIVPSEVKFIDRRKTNCCESARPARLHQSGTKVRGSKTIRYRRSPNHKRYRPGIGL